MLKGWGRREGKHLPGRQAGGSPLYSAGAAVEKGSSSSIYHQCQWRGTIKRCGREGTFIFFCFLSAHAFILPHVVHCVLLSLCLSPLTHHLLWLSPSPLSPHSFTFFPLHTHCHPHLCTPFLHTLLPLSVLFSLCSLTTTPPYFLCLPTYFLCTPFLLCLCLCILDTFGTLVFSPVSPVCSCLPSGTRTHLLLYTCLHTTCCLHTPSPPPPPSVSVTAILYTSLCTPAPLLPSSPAPCLYYTHMVYILHTHTSSWTLHTRILLVCMLLSPIFPSVIVCSLSLLFSLTFLPICTHTTLFIFSLLSTH